MNLTNRPNRKFKKVEVILAVACIMAVALVSCSTLQPKVSFMAGINNGGIIENTDLSVVSQADNSPELAVDAYTGATKVGFNAGVHLNQPIGKNEVETGLDYMFNHHTFKYNDVGNNYSGKRQIRFSQFMVPVTYNFVLARKIDLQFKLGLTAQINVAGVDDESVMGLPDYKIHWFSAGPTLGFSAYPFTFTNGNKLGLYFDFYRGSQVYEDFYNRTNFEMPGSSYFKGGIKFQF